ncbi:unnamed protein product [Hyaloperonospora brassicae]|uniref:GTP-binding protein Parf n=1 Tax=Hyaloperonospora brassicae TaxID=162125 RepID=A0AAV0TKY7_HYABA|nr:unnamed protein product [Hyaloperonospora brassicae]
MGNEASRGAGAPSPSPQSAGVVPPRSPYTPTGSASRHAQGFHVRAPSPTAAGTRVGVSSSRTDPVKNLRKDRTIQHMDKAIRRRVRGAVTYNMKLLIRGATGTGKTSLFQRLKGEPIPETHRSSPQLQCATINWALRQQLEETVKCDVWDVVDRGFVPGEAEEKERKEDLHGSVCGAVAGVGTSDQVCCKKLMAESVSASATVAAVAAAMQDGAQHFTGTADASTVDVYYEAHGVIFMVDITKYDTLEYVRRELNNVPVHIPTLVLGNFRDQGAHRQIYTKDIQQLLYGSNEELQRQQQWRRPTELLYFECSLLDCYGLKSLHQYFGIPFLQLKLATIRKQMRIVEDEFAHLKHDVQATVTEQRYVEYVKLIKTTGSDIRTGRRGSGCDGTPAAASQSNSVVLCPDERGTAMPVTGQYGGHVDVSVVTQDNGAGTLQQKDFTVAATICKLNDASPCGEVVTKHPDNNAFSADVSSADATTAASTCEYKDSVVPVSDDAGGVVAAELQVKSYTEQRSEVHNSSNACSSYCEKTLPEDEIYLEDFQVPKTSIGDLKQFYSENESDEDHDGNDNDVVVTRGNVSIKATARGVYHKQPFLDSDSSNSDDGVSMKYQRRRGKKALRDSSLHRETAEPANNVTNEADRQQFQSPPTSTSSLPLPASLRSRQESRPGSPVRASLSEVRFSLSSPMNKSHSAPCEVLSKHRQRCSPIASKAALSTSAPASSRRHKSGNRVAVTIYETRNLESPADSEWSSSRKESALTRTEDPKSLGGQLSPLKCEKLKNVTDGAVDRAGGVSNQARISSPTSETDTEENERSITPVQEALDKSTVCEPKGDVHLHEQAISLVNEKVNGRSADIASSDSSTGSPSKLDTSFADYEEKANHDDGGTAEVQVAADAIGPPKSATRRSPYRHQNELIADKDSDDRTSDEGGFVKGDGTSREESLLIANPPASVLPLPVQPGTAKRRSATKEERRKTLGHLHQRNLHMHVEGDTSSLSALQASLPLPDETASPLSRIQRESVEVRMGDFNDINGCVVDAAHVLSDSLPVSIPKARVPNFGTIVPSNDLEAFLNESDSESDHASPSAFVSPAAGTERLTERRINGRKSAESSDDGDDEDDQKRFVSYSISKKKRSAQRRQHKEDLRQLHAALENDPFTSSASAASTTSLSLETPNVLDALRKAEEVAMRMVSTDPAFMLPPSNFVSSKKQHSHKHKHKQERKNRDDEVRNSRSIRKSSRKQGSSSRSRSTVDM